MKIIHQGDIHFRSTRPVNRKDNYLQAQLDKFIQLLTWSHNYNAPVLCSGDLLDVPNVKFDIYNRVQEALIDYAHAGVISCSGNHDIFFHNNATINDTAFGGLKIAKHIQFKKTIDLSGSVVVHSVGWEEEPPTPELGKINILLAHISVFEKEVPWYWKGEGHTPKSLRKTYPGFGWYLCGDIHDPVVDGQVNVSGSMMRQTINQIDYKPRCYLIDLETSKIEPLFYKIEKDVFIVPDKQIKEDLNLDDLILALGESELSKTTYKRDCLTLAETHKPAKKIITEIFDGLN